MITIAIGGALLLLLHLLDRALARMPTDDQLRRRLERSEYRPLVLHIWHH